MKEITGFRLNGCPYCASAQMAFAELVKENPAYGDVKVTWYEENENPEALEGYSFYYAPSLFIGNDKVYEAQPGQQYDEIKAHVKEALDKALQ